MIIGLSCFIISFDMQNKVSNFPYKNIRHLSSAPLIIAMIFPLVILDVCLEIYHQIAFPLYNIPVNKRRNYIKIDRQKLSYLNSYDKLWCMYCGYANGLLGYAVKVAGDTEKYWCGVKNYPAKGYVEPAHHKEFLEYGDEEAYDKFIEK